MEITKDVKRFADIQYNIGYLASQTDKDYADELSDMISDYVTELFIAKTDLAIVHDVERGEP